MLYNVNIRGEKSKMGNKKVLIVEDEFSINDILTIALKREGYDVRSAYTYKEAGGLFETFKPELVLLDRMLPDGDGLDLCKIIYKECLVIMITAKDDIVDKILGIEFGADDYILKPFDIREVLTRIRALFRRVDKMEVKSKCDNKFNDELIIDLEGRKAFNGRKEIQLKRKEFDLLAYLHKNRNKVISRDELLDKVWGFDFTGETRTVDVHVRRLREKLDNSSDNSIIETIFGVGYVMR